MRTIHTLPIFSKAQSCKKLALTESNPKQIHDVLINGLMGNYEAI